MGHPFEIRKRSEGDIAILDLVGDLTIGAPEQKFLDAVAECVERKQTRILVNLEAVEFMDSSGIGALVQIYTTLTRLGGRLMLLKPRGATRHTLNLTGLLGVLQISDDEVEALASL